MAATTHLLSYEEWLKLPTVEDGRDEVVNGELHFMPPNHYPQADVVQLLIQAFLPRVDTKKVRILGSNFGLMIRQEPLTCRSPDLAVFWKDDRVIRDGLDWAAPGLVVEVFSPSETKRRKEGKINDYARIGVPEVWLVSPEAEIVEVRLLKDGRFESSAILVDGELRPSRFPGVSIPISTIWPD